MNLRFVGLVSSLVLVACAAENEPSVGGDESDFTQAKSALERPLSPGLAVPTETPIGTSIEAVVSAKASGRTASTPTTSGECTVTRYSASGGTTMSYEKCATKSFLRIYGTERMPIIVYADHNGDGKVDGFRDESGPLYDVDDGNYDGKVDRIVEAAERVGTIDIAAFGEGWRVSNGGRLANRILEDNDHDGTFELESITAKSPEMFVR